MGEIKADPTKEFFIYMIGRDIGLSRAIIDLVDNCLDGAKRLRPDGDYTGLFIRIHVALDRFEISDNCGGIPLPLAKEYAFRFGRPKNMPRDTEYAIGQFGVGMKRALFKMGKNFTVSSRTVNDHFTVTVDVEEWISREQDWTFELTDEGEEERPLEETGTSIVVENLLDGVSDKFQQVSFLNTLRSELSLAHKESLSKGLSISLNETPIDFETDEVFSSDELAPMVKEQEYQENGSPIRVKIIVGISEDENENPKRAGWYIYCNGRCILAADKTLTTGWGASEEQEIPRYHGQFSKFRGYVFFDSNDVEALPWNTTKTGVDEESALYRATRQEMIVAMRPVIDFLNLLDREINAPPGDTHASDIVSAAEKVSLKELPLSPSFNVEFKADKPRPQRKKVVQYEVDADKLETVRARLGVVTQREVGERTFNFYYELNCDD